MNEKARKESIDAMFELYPRGRKLIYKAFDKLEDDLTRTQQIILLALAVKDNLSMSQLAGKICTSNEQATRAVTQLVDKGLVNRMQNKTNRRVVNISLTQNGRLTCYCRIICQNLDSLNILQTREVHRQHLRCAQLPIVIFIYIIYW